jgi:hypothetical protein
MNQIIEKYKILIATIIILIILGIAFWQYIPEVKQKYKEYYNEQSIPETQLDSLQNLSVGE